MVFAAELPPEAQQKRSFWVWDLSVMPPGFRRAEATLRVVGKRSLIYVEDSLWQTQIQPDYAERLNELLENTMPAGSLATNQGLVSFEENLFGSLPKRINPDDRLIVLFANLGQYKDHQFDGFFNAYDQQTEAEARLEGQHSNESNIIYINGFRGSETYTNGVIAHELQHLLESSQDKEETADSWLSETIAEGAMLVTGHFADQLHVNRFAKSSGEFPLVSSSYVSYGPQILFASFLLDFAEQREDSLRLLSNRTVGGRQAVEQLFERVIGTPQSFDAIFSSFLSYLFTASSEKLSLPLAWKRPEGLGLSLPTFTPAGTINTIPGSFEGKLFPYSFVVIDLAEELSPSAQVEVRLLPADPGSKSICGRTASVLWKPVTKKRVAVYSVGCEPKSKQDFLHFRLTILDKPSLPR